MAKVKLGTCTAGTSFPKEKCNTAGVIGVEWGVSLRLKNIFKVALGTPTNCADELARPGAEAMLLLEGRFSESIKPGGWER